jgi:hypothetical protein
MFRWNIEDLFYNLIYLRDVPDGTIQKCPVKKLHKIPFLMFIGRYIESVILRTGLHFVPLGTVYG